MENAYHPSFKNAPCGWTHFYRDFLDRHVHVLWDYKSDFSFLFVVNHPNGVESYDFFLKVSELAFF
jgi:hypothetical protein